VRRFLLLTKELDADDAEITRTRKVRLFRGWRNLPKALQITCLYPPYVRTKLMLSQRMPSDTWKRQRKGIYSARPFADRDS